MRNQVHIILASLALLLGVAHIGFGIVVYKAFTLEVLWFLSFGLAAIVTALANFKSDGGLILRLQNFLTLGFICVVAFLAPGPQIISGGVLFTGLFGLSCLKKSQPA